MPGTLRASFGVERNRALLKEFDGLVGAFEKLSPKAQTTLAVLLRIQHYPNAPPRILDDLKDAREAIKHNNAFSKRGGHPQRFSILEAGNELLRICERHRWPIHVGAKYSHRQIGGEYRFNRLVSLFGDLVFRHSDEKSLSSSKRSKGRTVQDSAHLAAWNAIQWLLKTGSYRKPLRETKRGNRYSSLGRAEPNLAGKD